MAKDNALEIQRDQIAKAVGHALATWTWVELTLTFVFVGLMDRSKKPVIPGLISWDQEDRGRRLAHTAFNAIIALDTRADVVTALIEESGINKDLRGLWPGLRNRLLKKYKSRHQIAHFLLENVEQDGGKWKAALAPFAASVGSRDETRLGLAEIEQKRSSFREMHEALIWYREAIEKSRGRRKEPLEPEPPMIGRIRQSLRLQTRPKP